MDFFERMKRVMSQGVETTRKGMEQAADKARELGEKGVLKYEIVRLEKDVERKFAMLGSQTYRMLSEKPGGSLSGDVPEVGQLVREIKELQDRIEEKEKALGAVGKG